MDNPGFRSLREAFKNFANKYSKDDLGARAIRSLAAGGEAAVDRGMKEFPKTFVNQLANDLYGLITSQEVADGVSETVRSFDEEKVKEMLDGVVGKLKDYDTALKLAGKVKEILNKNSPDDLEAALDAMLDKGGAPMGQRMMVVMLFSQFKPVLENMKNATDEEIANQLITFADQIPVDAIAEQVGAMTREVTPERVSKQAHDIVGGLPSPDAVSDIVHGIGETARQSLNEASKISSPSEVGDILRNFAQNASDMANDILSKDTQAKKTFKPKGNDFDL